MKEKGKVSIIIPVYKVEKYIDECFESIVAQKNVGYEVIIVDDGSCDLSPEVCDMYAARDARFCVIHSGNHGVAAARNLAMSYMSGDYCFFLDPDDVLETGSLAYLVELIEKTNSDMALAVTRRFSGVYTPAKETNVKECIFETREDIIEKVLFDKNDVKPLHRKRETPRIAYEYVSTLYRTSQLNQNNIRFIPLTYGEDTYVCFKSLLTSKKVVTSSRVVYAYRRNLASTSFQYHQDFLEETYRYYEYYHNLFEEYASDCVSRADEGLNGQYLFRCLTAIEGELFFSPVDKSILDKIKTVGQIRNDRKFRKLFTFDSMKYTSGKRYTKILIGVKLRLYPLIVVLISIARKMRQN